MAHPKLILSLLAVALFVGGAQSAQASGPPPGLTSNGQVLWNLDALLNDTFGHRVECFDSQRYQIFAVAHGSYCPAPSARYQEWDFSFLNAYDSNFRLVSLTKEPRTGVTNVAVRVGQRYVSCPGGKYHNGRRGWLVFGGGAGPTGQFWCN